MWKSAPSGPATFSRKKVPTLFPEMRRIDFADEETEGERVIAVARTRLPPRLLLGERGGHRVPVVDRLLRERLAHRGQAGLVREQPAHRDRALVLLRELRPVLRDRCVEVEQPRSTNWCAQSAVMPLVVE